jgi:hypothetical protein
MTKTLMGTTWRLGRMNCHPPGQDATIRKHFNDSNDLPSVAGIESMNVGPSHHGMARPQVADGGTAFDMEGSCE